MKRVLLSTVLCLALGMVFLWRQSPEAQAAQGAAQTVGRGTQQPAGTQNPRPTDNPQTVVRGIQRSTGTPQPANGTLPLAPIDPGRPWGWMVKAFMENPDQKLYNRAKQRLLEGQQVFSHVMRNLDVETYCRQAPHYDFTWFEMQHSLMTFADVRQMVQACPHVGAAPIIRMPDSFEANTQKAFDIGMLGIVIPTVDNAAEARDAAIHARFPPVARRSSGNTLSGEAPMMWNPLVPPGLNYRRSINDNTLVVVMIETVEGVDNALEIASTPGVDVVFMGSNDLQEFSGFAMNDDRFEDLLIRVRNATYLAGKFFGNVLGGKANRLYPDSRFNEGGPAFDGWVDPVRGVQSAP